MLPLVHRLLRQLEVGSGVRRDPAAFYGFSMEAPPELTIEDIARDLGPLFEYSDPDQHTEKIRFFDVVRRTIPYVVREEDPLLAGVYTVELVRQAVPGRAVAVVRTIATWVRATPSGAVAGTPIELFDGVTMGATPQGSPFPFPLAHPDGGRISIEYTLIREGVASTGFGGQPAFAGPVVQPPEIIPTDTPILSPWADMRFPWTDSGAANLYWVVGERSLLRLFATITITGEGAWNLELAGRLAGDITITGYLKRALVMATERH